MNGNLAYQEEPREELLNGEIVMMVGIARYEKNEVVFSAWIVL